MTAEIISVGTELLLGNILNTNAQYLSRELADLGITVQRESTAVIFWSSPAAWAPR